VLAQHRSTQRRRSAARDQEAALVKRLLELVAKHPRYGYRRIWALLRSEGWRVNRKRVFRLWRQQGLKVPRKKRQKRRLGSSANGCVRYRATGKDHVWAWDFIHDRTADGRPLKWLSVVDEYTRECLALEVGRGLKASGVVAVLEGLVRQRGVPGHSRSDNGPEFIAQAIGEWLLGRGVGGLYIEPGAPWENGYAESFHGKLRDELLEREEFASVLEARVVSEAWKEEYNTVRPHSALGYRTPAEYGASCPRAASAKPPPARGHEESSGNG
jgi:putative transposase